MPEVCHWHNVFLSLSAFLFCLLTHYHCSHALHNSFTFPLLCSLSLSFPYLVPWPTSSENVSDPVSLLQISKSNHIWGAAHIWISLVSGDITILVPNKTRDQASVSLKSQPGFPVVSANRQHGELRTPGRSTGVHQPHLGHLRPPKSTISSPLLLLSHGEDPFLPSRLWSGRGTRFCGSVVWALTRCL